MYPIQGNRCGGSGVPLQIQINLPSSPSITRPGVGAPHFSCGGGQAAMPAPQGLGGVLQSLQTWLSRLEGRSQRCEQRGLERSIDKLEGRKKELTDEIARLNAAQAHLKKIGATKHKAQWAANADALKRANEELKRVEEKLGCKKDRLDDLKSCHERTASQGNTSPWFGLGSMLGQLVSAIKAWF